MTHGRFFGEQTLLVYFPVRVDHETDIWKVSGNAHSRASIPRAVKLELLYKESKLILSSFRESTFSGFSCVSGKVLKMPYHPKLTNIAANL